jgi:REP element-mobilizing transposase RayT
MSDRIHPCIEIPPKYSVESIINFFKGKSAAAITRQVRGKIVISTGVLWGEGRYGFNCRPWIGSYIC